MRARFVSYLDVFQIAKAYFSRKTNDKIYYFDISRTGKILQGLLGSNQHIAPFIFNLDEVRDESGKGRVVKIFGEDLNEVCMDIGEELKKENQFVTELGKKFDKEKVVLFFMKRIAFEIQDVVAFINVIDWYKQRESEKFQDVIEFSIERTPCFEILKDFALREYNISLNPYTSLRSVLGFFYQLFGNLYLSIILLIKPVMQWGHFHRSERMKKTDNVPILASYYSPNGLTFEQNKRCDFFWLLKSRIPHEQVLIYFGRKDMPATETMVNILNANGVKYVAMSKGATVTGKMPVYKPSIGLIKMLFSLTASVVTQALRSVILIRFRSLTFLSGAIYFIREYSEAYDFYHSMGIKVDVDSSDFGVQHIPRHLALETLGGVSVSFQRAHTPVPQIRGGSTADVYFVFGPYYYSMLKGNVCDHDTIVTCGYITDYSFATVKDSSRVLRKKITKNGAKFIICYFDENSSAGRFSIIPNKKSAYVYRKLLNLVISEKAVGLICSPKRPKTIHERLSSITDIIQKAEATGRCLFLEGDYTASNYPTEAAQASDIVISLLLGGTASLESALSGKRVVYLDLEGFYSFREYKWGKDTIVFDNLDSLITAIEKYRCNPNSFDEFGNIGMMPVLKQKDPFRDGKAAERIGHYLHWLLETFNEEKTREEAMECANQNYAEMWGSENVFQYQ
ncbi:MAG: hypothetical protein GY777_07630 [Candidatus Brocadiaceae bacterium]|nr:hypothetical protein [Candidatus Brocadiaceae bacterium]